MTPQKLVQKTAQASVGTGKHAAKYGWENAGHRLLFFVPAPDSLIPGGKALSLSNFLIVVLFCLNHRKGFFHHGLHMASQKHLVWVLSILKE